ncbi:MAG: hypothetical protein JW893_07040 [Candidatus Omnitrophica bacterium]|nr:hypothetical protein [Candidatus Omnitrophota bacterium]
MCGIAGFWNLNGNIADPSVVRQMVAQIRHRGPDDDGIWTEGSIGIGHSRLSILDLSSCGHQPFITADAQGILSYNGEVYNFKELKCLLKKEGIVFKSHTDTEVVLYALHRWGPEKAVSLFNGMFAFVYFDRRSQRLWMARDRLGIKPLYWTRHGNVLVFGSEIKAILKHPEILPVPDLMALASYTIQR